MKKNIRLTEQELVGLISKILKEQDNPDKEDFGPNKNRKGFSDMVENRAYSDCFVIRHHGKKLRVNCINNGILFETYVTDAKTL